MAQTNNSLTIHPYPCDLGRENSSGSVSGSNISFSFPVSSYTMNVNGTVNGHLLSGTFSDTLGSSGTWRGEKRISAPSCLKPTIISTNPSNGQTGVSRSLATISVTFSEPMRNSVGIGSSGGFNINNPQSTSFTANMRTFTLTRHNPETLLPSNTSSTIYLGYQQPGWDFMSSTGVSIDPYQFTFTTGN